MTIKRVLLAVPLIFAGWIGVMALVMRFSDAAPAAVVPWPGTQFMNNLPSQAAVIEVNSLAITFANRNDLVRELYLAGAWLVLPAGLTGCLPLSAEKRKELARM